MVIKEIFLSIEYFHENNFRFFLSIIEFSLEDLKMFDPTILFPNLDGIEDCNAYYNNNCLYENTSIN